MRGNTTRNWSQPPSDNDSYGDDQYNLETTLTNYVGPYTYQRTHSRLLDWDGDGDLDQLVVRGGRNPYPSGPTPPKWVVRINEGGQLGPAAQLTDIPWSQMMGQEIFWEKIFSNDSYVIQDTVDVNGDGRPDILYRDSTLNDRVYACFGKSTGFQPCILWLDAAVDGLAASMNINLGTARCEYVTTVDINGDGYLDLLQRNHTPPEDRVYVFLGSPSGMSEAPFGELTGTPWPIALNGKACLRAWDRDALEPGNNRLIVDLRDVNGDGLVDIVTRTGPEGVSVMYNKGNLSFTPSHFLGEGLLSSAIAEGEALNQELAGLYDMNGDGLLDRVEGPVAFDECDNYTGRFHLKVWLNKGNGWAGSAPVCWMYPDDVGTCQNPVAGNPLSLRFWITATAQNIYRTFPTEASKITALKNALLDFDGDGKPEIVRAARDINFLETDGNGQVPENTIRYNTPWCVLKSTASLPYELDTIHSGAGLTQTVDHGHVNAAPYPVRVITAVRRQDDNMPVETGTTAEMIESFGGRFDFVDRQFRGFSYVTSTRDQALRTTHSYLQDEFTVGLEYLTQILDLEVSFSTPLRSEQIDYVEMPLDQYSGRKWVRPTAAWTRDYDPIAGGAPLREKKKEYAYHDQQEWRHLGLLKRIRHLGNEDDRYETYDYYVVDDPEKYLVAPKTLDRAGHNGVLFAREQYLYDAQCSTAGAPIERGLLCKKSVARGAPGSSVPDAEWRYSYTPWGSRETVTDPDNIITTYSYHASDMAVANEQNAAGHTISYSKIHPFTRTARQVCGPQSGRCSEQILDKLGREREVWVPTETQPGVYVKHKSIEIAINDAGGSFQAPPSVAVTYHPDPAAPTEVRYERKYFNARNQVTMSEKSMPASQWTKTYYGYDRWGRLAKACKPRLGSQPGPGTSMPAPDYLYVHDVLNRPTRIQEPGGALTNVSYRGAEVIVNDARGYSATYRLSAHDQIAQIERAGAGYTERIGYQYGPTGLMLSASSSSGENYSWEYYADGSLKRAFLPDSAETHYQRSNAGRIQTVDYAGGGRVAYSYDSIGRVEMRNLTLLSPTTCYDPHGDRLQIMNYDCNSRNVGRLCSVDLGNGYHVAYDYDAQDRTTYEEVSNAQSRISVQRSYNALGDLTSTTYPNGLSIDILYGPHGLPKEYRSGGATFAWADYNAALKLTSTNGNLASLGIGAAGTYSRTLQYGARSILVGHSGGMT